MLCRMEQVCFDNEDDRAMCARRAGLSGLDPQHVFVLSIAVKYCKHFPACLGVLFFNFTRSEFVLRYKSL